MMEHLQLMDGTLPATGSLSLSVADSTSGSNLGNRYGLQQGSKLVVNAGSDSDVKLNGLTITRGGLSANAHVAGLGVYDEQDVRHGNIGTS